MRFCLRFIQAAAFALCLATITAQAQPAPACVYGSIQKDVAYKPTSPANTLDVYYPAKGTPPYPTHIYLHGGGWTGGSKKIGGNAAAVFQQLAQNGFLGVAVEYRRVDAKENRYLRTCVVDCMDALRYLFTHAKEFQIDPTNVFVWGSSAGGHLTLLCAIVPADAFPGEVPLPAGGMPIKAVVAWYPPTDMPNYEAISVKFNGKLRALNNRMGTTPEKDPALFVELSPLDRLTRSAPPTLIFHGDSDGTVNLEHSTRFVQKAKALGVPCELVVVKNANHGFGPVKGQTISPSLAAIESQTVQAFVAQAAKNPPPPAAK